MQARVLRLAFLAPALLNTALAQPFPRTTCADHDRDGILDTCVHDADRNGVVESWIHARQDVLIAASDGFLTAQACARDADEDELRRIATHTLHSLAGAPIDTDEERSPPAFFLRLDPAWRPTLALDLRHAPPGSLGFRETGPTGFSRLGVIAPLYGFCVLMTNAPFTADALAKVDLLLTPSPLQAMREDERQALTNWIARGGTWLLTVGGSCEEDRLRFSGHASLLGVEPAFAPTRIEPGADPALAGWTEDLSALGPTGFALNVTDPWTPLLSYSNRTLLAEKRLGKGRIMLCGVDLLSNAFLSPTTNRHPASKQDLLAGRFLARLKEPWRALEVKDINIANARVAFTVDGRGGTVWVPGRFTSVELNGKPVDVTPHERLAEIVLPEGQTRVVLQGRPANPSNGAVRLFRRTRLDGFMDLYAIDEDGDRAPERLARYTPTTRVLELFHAGGLTVWPHTCSKEELALAPNGPTRVESLASNRLPCAALRMRLSDEGVPFDPVAPDRSPGFYLICPAHAWTPGDQGWIDAHVDAIDLREKAITLRVKGSGGRLRWPASETSPHAWIDDASTPTAPIGRFREMDLPAGTHTVRLERAAQMPPDQSAAKTRESIPNDTHRPETPCGIEPERRAYGADEIPKATLWVEGQGPYAVEVTERGPRGETLAVRRLSLEAAGTGMRAQTYYDCSTPGVHVLEAVFRPSGEGDALTARVDLGIDQAGYLKARAACDECHRLAGRIMLLASQKLAGSPQAGAQGELAGWYAQQARASLEAGAFAKAEREGHEGIARIEAMLERLETFPTPTRAPDRSSRWERLFRLPR